MISVSRELLSYHQKDVMSSGIMMSIREQMYQKMGRVVFMNNIYSSKWNLTIEIKVLLEETLAQCWFPTQDLMKIFIDTEFDSWAIFSGTHDSFTQLFRNKFILCRETEYISYNIVILKCKWWRLQIILKVLFVHIRLIRYIIIFRWKALSDVFYSWMISYR